jgi:hypothetical protein
VPLVSNKDCNAAVTRRTSADSATLTEEAQEPLQILALLAWKFTLLVVMESAGLGTRDLPPALAPVKTSLAIAVCMDNPQ